MSTNSLSQTSKNQIQLYTLSRIQNPIKEQVFEGNKTSSASNNQTSIKISVNKQNQIRGLEKSLKNTNNGVTLLRTAEGAMEQISELLSSTRELALKSSNDNLTNTDRGAIYSEISQLLNEVHNIAKNTEFNYDHNLEDHTTLSLQSGASADQRLNSILSSINLDTLGLSNYADIFKDATKNNVKLGGAVLSGFADNLDSANKAISTNHAELGTLKQRLTNTANDVSNSSNNLNATNSSIPDANIAQQSILLYTEYAHQQSALSIMAQANINQGAGFRLLM